jgi:signal transduction histidine kinase
VISRLARWYDARPVAGDACLAALLLLFALPTDLSAPERPLLDLAFSFALLACVPFRRRAPVTVFVLVAVICLVQFAVLDHIVTGDFVALIALYTLVAYGPDPRLSLLATACTVVGAALAALRWETGEVSLLEAAGTTVVSVLLAAAVGAWRRARVAQLAVERDQQAAAERARIARELHDVVAHSLAVIVVQADGAAAAAQHRPAAATEALTTIGDTARDALTQMRRLLGLLRDGGTRAEPVPGTAQLDALVTQVSRAGLPARLSVEGEPREVPGTIGATVYRVAQEALTNVIKHAGSVSRVDVVLRYRDDAVEVVVRDDGRGAPPGHDGGGHGLTGMRERVRLQHGTLAVGPAADGGFAVRAVIPTA